MTNETQQTSSTETKPTPFGARLASARESLGLERKDAAAQLRLNENIILMMETDRYPTDLPVTFIRGYLRAYGKLLQIAEDEIKKAIEPIKPRPSTGNQTPTTFTSMPVTSGNYFMQLFTSLIVLTLIGLVGMWWYSHSAIPSPTQPVNTVAMLPENTPAAVAANANVVTNASTDAPTSQNPSQTQAPQAAAPLAAAVAPLVNPAREASAENSVDTAKKAPRPKAAATIKTAPAKNIASAKPMVPVEEAIPSDGPLSSQDNSE
jgi:cytoskeleton protein RodZ